MAGRNGILKYLEKEQCMEIARSCGVTTYRQVAYVASGESQNLILLQKLVEKANENKRLLDRALELSTA